MTVYRCVRQPLPPTELLPLVPRSVPGHTTARQGNGQKKKGCATAAQALGQCFRGAGDKTNVRADTSRTQTFDTKTPDNVPERIRKSTNLTDHPACLYPPLYSGTQLNESLHRLLNALPRLHGAAPTGNFNICNSFLSQ